MSRTRGSRLRAGAMTAAVAALMVVLAVMLANAQGVGFVADRGIVAVNTESVLSTAAAARNRTVQALVIAAGREVGATTDRQVAGAVAAAESALSALDDRFEVYEGYLGSADAEVHRKAFGELVAAARGVLTAAEAGEIDAADALVEDRLEPAYETLVSLAANERNSHLQALSAAMTESGRVADAARFLVAFAVPFGAILIYRRGVQRRQRALLLEKELERERAISSTKDEFIANLSHELRTPLTGIYGFGMALLDSLPSGEAEREMAGLIAGEASDLSRMVDDLLTAAAADHKGVAITIEPVGVDDQVADVVAPFKALGQELGVSIEPAVVLVDRLRLRQVLRNLISNAFKHGGPNVTLTGTTRGAEYVLSISDDGAGVPDHVESRMFQRFVHEGSEPLLTGSVGLGLSIAHLLTEQMGGRIEHERREGRTVFSVSFPLVVADEEAKATSGVGAVDG